MKSQHASVYNEVTSIKNPEGEHMCPPPLPQGSDRVMIKKIT